MAIGSLTTGATQGGAVTQMVARGAADFHLTGGSKVTYWRMRHTTHTNFATEMIQQSFGANPQFGGTTASALLHRTGDLAHRQYVVMDLPGLYPRVTAGHTTSYAYVLDALAAETGGDYMPDPELQAGLTNPMGGYYAHWTNAVGFAALASVRLIVGSHIIDTLYREYLYMLEELTGKAGKRLQDMVGKFETREQLVAYSSRPQRMYVPLPFWYHQVAGNALSLVSLPYHGVQLSVEFTALKDLIVVSNRDIKVYKTNADGTDSGSLVQDNDLSACILTEYVYLDLAERSRFRRGLFDQLITTVQRRQLQFSSGATPEVQLHFNHPVSELIFACRLKANEEANQWFDFSRVGPAQGSGSTRGHPTKVALQPQTEGTFDLLVEPETVGSADWDSSAALTQPNLVSDAGRFNIGNVVTVNADPLIEVGFRVNNLSRYSPMEGKFYRQVMPYQHHSNIPKGFIYNMPFSLFPEEANPSGSLNWSRLDSGILDLELHADIVGESVTIIIYARNWNVFSYVEGIGGQKFQ